MSFLYNLPGPQTNNLIIIELLTSQEVNRSQNQSTRNIYRIEKDFMGDGN